MKNTSNNTMVKSILFSTLAMIAYSSSAFSLDCVKTESKDAQLCISLPPEAPESPKTLSMVTTEETSGNALSLESELNAFSTLDVVNMSELEVGDLSLNGLLGAEQAQDQVRSIDLFLRSGLVSGGSLGTVNTFSKK